MSSSSSPSSSASPFLFSSFPPPLTKTDPTSLSPLHPIPLLTGNPLNGIIRGILWCQQSPHHTHPQQLMNVSPSSASSSTSPLSSSSSSISAASSSTSPSPSNNKSTISYLNQHRDYVKSDSSLLFVWDIPCHLPLNELFHFFFPFIKYIKQLKLCTSPAIDTAASHSTSPSSPSPSPSPSTSSYPSYFAPNTYILLLHLSSPQAADLFRQEYDTRAYNSIEPDVCKIDNFYSVEFEEDKGIILDKFPMDFIKEKREADKNEWENRKKEEKKENGEAEGGEVAVMEDSSSSTDYYCSVCLESSSSSSSSSPSSPLLTLLCLHSFHFECLSYFHSNSCAVCRYSIVPPIQSSCSSCSYSISNNLWMCLVCGLINCGRREGGHSLQHFSSTSHPYCINIETKQVWDYRKDSFVYRLIQSKENNGELIEVGNNGENTDLSMLKEGTGTGGGSSRRWEEGQGRRGEEGENRYSSINHHTHSSSSIFSSSSHITTNNKHSVSLSNSLKLEDLLIEYNYLLESQLNQQKTHFNQLINKENNIFNKNLKEKEEKYDKLIEKNEYFNKKYINSTKYNEELNNKQKTIEENIVLLENNNNKLKLCIERENTLINNIKEEEKREKEEKYKDLSKLLANKDKEIREIEEQLQDIKFYIKSQKKIEKSVDKDDIIGGKMYVSDEGKGERKGEEEQGQNNDKKKKKKGKK